MKDLEINDKGEGGDPWTPWLQYWLVHALNTYHVKAREALELDWKKGEKRKEGS